jgi:hypothetical protein
MKTGSPWNAGAARRFDDPRIIEFKPRPRSGRRRPVPPIIDPLLQWESDEYRLRMQQNFLAITVLIIILAVGLWLFHELAMSSRTLLCVEADHANCVPIDQRGSIK